MKSLIIELSKEKGRHYKKINGTKSFFSKPEDLDRDLQTFRGYRDKSVKEIINQNIGSALFRRIGKSLFEAIFDSDNLRELLEFDRSDEKVCRLNFRITADELTNYPWELMHNGYDWLWNIGFSIVRYTPIRDEKAITLSPTLKLISFVCIPSGYLPNDPENIQKEIGEIIDGINKKQNSEMISFKPLTNIPSKKILNEIEIYKPHIFLFIGHGAIKGEDSVIKLIDETGMEDPYDYEKVKDLFSSPLAKENLGLVIFSGCQTASGYNSVAQAVIDAGIPNCIGMSSTVNVRDAFYKFPQEFLTKFFINFFINNLSIEIGFNEAKRVLRLDDFGTPEWVFPCLFLNYSSETVFQNINDEHIILPPGEKNELDTIAKTIPTFIDDRYKG